MLGASVWEPKQPTSSTVAVVVNPGAGIPAAFYSPFAQWLSEKGVPALTYDYRGIGCSKQGRLRGFETSVEEWGSKDCAAAISAATSLFPARDLVVIGHSIGAFLTGFVTLDAPEVQKYVFVAAHTGYWRDYRSATRIPMFLAWHAAMPAINRLFGYFPGRWFGLPADLPYGIAREWARRTRPDFWWYLRNPDGTPDSARIDALKQRFSARRGSGLLITFHDDPFASDAASRRISTLFDSISFDRWDIEPAALEAHKIGHFGFLSRRMRTTLWPKILAWLQHDGRKDEHASERT